MAYTAVSIASYADGCKKCRLLAAGHNTKFTLQTSYYTQNTRRKKQSNNLTETKYCDLNGTWLQVAICRHYKASFCYGAILRWGLKPESCLPKNLALNTKFKHDWCWHFIKSIYTEICIGTYMLQHDWCCKPVRFKPNATEMKYLVR